jgi:hypothetical protein
VATLSRNDADDLRAATYASAAMGAVFAGSAVYGMHQVNRCRRARNSEGVGRPQQRMLEDREAEGTHGGDCREDGSCDGELVCDETMRVCIPLQSPEE